MNTKKILLTLCAASIAHSTTYSMYSLTRYTPRASYQATSIIPSTQKRNLSQEHITNLTETIASTEAASIGACAIIYGGYRVTSYVYEVTKPTRYKNDAYKYVQECSQGKHAILLNEQLLKQLDKGTNERLHFLLQLKQRYEQLEFVEMTEISNYLQCTNEQESNKYRNILTTINDQQDRIFDVVNILEKDMPHYQKNYEEFYEKILGRPRVTALIKDSIAKSIKEQRTLINDIKQQHELSKKTVPLQTTDQE